MAWCQSYTVTLPSGKSCAEQPERGGLDGLRHEVCPRSSRRRMQGKMESAKKKNYLARQHPKPELALPGQLPMATTSAVKTNPLFSRPSSSHPPDPHCGAGAGVSVQGAGEDGPVFYGQRKNIRKTKEQEMINAIAQLAQYGEKRKRRTPSLLNKVRSIGSHSPVKKFRSRDQQKSGGPHKATGGPFILRPRPPLKSNVYNIV